MKIKLVTPVTLVVLIFLSNASWAQFSLTAYLGDVNRSRAGGAAAAEDATTVFTNPAGMMRLENQQLIFASQTYFSSSRFENQGTADVLGNPIAGSNGGDGGGTTFVPGLYYSNRLSDQWGIGLGINAPFGLSTEYDRDWVGRYSSINSGIKTININPSVAYRITNTWSIGGGINFQKAEAELSSAVDFGAVCLSILDPTTCGTIGLGLPQVADGYAEIKGDDWSTGFNVGLLWASSTYRIGFSYRSKMEYNLEGDAKFTNPPQAAAFAPAFTNTNAHVPITLPEIISLSAYYDWTQRLAVMVDITHTKWSRVDKFQFKYDNPAQPAQNIAKNWEDTTRFAVGMDYDLTQKLNLQWGAAYESSAIPDSTYDPSVPISDAIWLNAGGKYHFNRQ
ncbi:MAG: outer membrane protein transport protein, partial [Gammaproteobacteria bacterium]